MKENKKGNRKVQAQLSLCICAILPKTSPCCTNNTETSQFLNNKVERTSQDYADVQTGQGM